MLITKIYLRYDLSFIDKTLESEYQLSRMNYHRMLLNIVILYGLLLGVVGWILNPLGQSDYFEWRRILSIVFIFLSALVIFIIGIKWPKISRRLLRILVLLFFFGFMEIAQINVWNQSFYFILGMNKEFLAISLVLAKNSWITSIILLFLMNMFCSFRYIDFGINYEMKFLPLIQFILNTFLQGLSAYFIERYDRDSFYKKKKYEHSHLWYKDLITKFFPSAVIILKDETILFHNQKTLTILECSEENQIRDKVESLQLEDLSKSFEKQMQRENVITDDCNPIINENFNETSIRMPQIWNYNLEKPKSYFGILELDSRKKGLEINLTRIMWDNEIALMIILTENKIIAKMKKLNENSEYKDRLLATVSHDLRTPLNGIMGMIRMTIEINEDVQTRKYLRIALRSSQLLLLMINDILDYSQISNGKLRLNFENFNLWTMIKDVSKLFKFQTKMKGIEFQKINLAGKGEQNTMIRSDQNRIKQVLFNLLGNALKFTVKGSIKITLSPLKEDVNTFSGCELVIAPIKAFMIIVEDTGIGIRREEQGTLFKLFGKIQNERTLSLNKNGVGLGLAISQSLVKILNKNKKGGEITVESEYGKGSCFSFALFSEDEDDNREELYQKSLEEKFDHEMSQKFHVLERELDKEWRNNSFTKRSKNIKRNKHVLVVDDDQINIFVVSTYLKTFIDYEFDVAFNGEEAIERIKEKAKNYYFYDIILMDYNMPKMNGPAATLVIDKMIHNEEIPTLAIIACSANASHNDHDFHFKNGTLDYITKPFSKEELRMKIEKN